MTVIFCIDDDNGISFGGRRQSSDRVLKERIFALIGDTPLYMSEYSKGQFADFENISVTENYLEECADGCCFAENLDFLEKTDDIDRVIVYHWNRKYPSDVKVPEFYNSYKLSSTFEFEGSSHDKITEEVYLK